MSACVRAGGHALATAGERREIGAWGPLLKKTPPLRAADGVGEGGSIMCTSPAVEPFDGMGSVMVNFCADPQGARACEIYVMFSDNSPRVAAAVRNKLVRKYGAPPIDLKVRAEHACGLSSSSHGATFHDGWVWFDDEDELAAGQIIAGYFCVDREQRKADLVLQYRNRPGIRRWAARIDENAANY